MGQTQENPAESEGSTPVIERPSLYFMAPESCLCKPSVEPQCENQFDASGHELSLVAGWFSGPVEPLSATGRIALLTRENEPLLITLERSRVLRLSWVSYT